MPDEIEAGSDTSTLPMSWPLYARVWRRQGALCLGQGQSGKIGVGVAEPFPPINPLWRAFENACFSGCSGIRRSSAIRDMRASGTPGPEKGLRFRYLSKRPASRGVIHPVADRAGRLPQTSFRPAGTPAALSVTFFSRAPVERSLILPGAAGNATFPLP